MAEADSEEPQGEPRSAERAFGWKGHLARLQRLHARLKHPFILNEWDEVLDDYLAFFVFSYSLRDWLIEEGVFTSNDLPEKMEASTAMRINRDMANRIKHRVLRRRPSEDEDWQLVAFGSAKFDPQGREFYRFFCSTKTTFNPAIKVAKACLEFWERLAVEVDQRATEKVKERG